MKSMTGYGRGEALSGEFKITVEAGSVNRKQGEFSVFLPRELEGLEPRVRTEINRRVARGKLTARINVESSDPTAAGGVQINKALARSYAAALKELAAELNLGGEVTLEAVIRAPGVIKADSGAMDLEAVWPGIEKALQAALDGLVGMREKEGAHLAADLTQRVATMKEAAARVAVLAPGMVQKYREQLCQRIQSAGLPLPKEEDERLLKEVVYFADRSDISEELTRLESHFKQFADCVSSPEPVGRTFDFLAQEMNREINTIGSKAADAAIAREVVLLKAELEKFREQVQNVE